MFQDPRKSYYLFYYFINNTNKNFHFLPSSHFPPSPHHTFSPSPSSPAGTEVRLKYGLTNIMRFGSVIFFLYHPILCTKNNNLSYILQKCSHQNHKSSFREVSQNSKRKTKCHVLFHICTLYFKHI